MDLYYYNLLKNNIDFEESLLFEMLEFENEVYGDLFDWGDNELVEKYFLTEDSVLSYVYNCDTEMYIKIVNKKNTFRNWLSNP